MELSECDGHHDVIAVSGQGLVNGVVHHFEHQVVQTRAIRRVADVHAWAFANGFQILQVFGLNFHHTLGQPKLEEAEHLLQVILVRDS
jgi:hypothetical protein